MKISKINLSILSLSILIARNTEAETLVINTGDIPTAGNNYYPSSASNNIVTASSANNPTRNIYGSYSTTSFTPTNNTILINNGSTFRGIFGSYSNNNANTSGNNITISDSTVFEVWGTYASTGQFFNNTVTIENSRVSDRVSAARNTNINDSSTVAAGNTVNIINSTIQSGQNQNVFGAYVSGTAYNNSIYVKDSHVYGRVMGGLGSVVYNNTVTIENSIVGGDVFGSEVKYRNDAAPRSNNNDIVLIGNVDINGFLYGGILTTPTSGAIVLDTVNFSIIEGNTLTLAPTTRPITVGQDAANFTFIEFDFSNYTGPTGQAADSILMVGGKMNLLPGNRISNISVTGVSEQSGWLNLVTQGVPGPLDFGGTLAQDIPGLESGYDFISFEAHNTLNNARTLSVEYGLNWFFADSHAHGNFTLNDGQSFTIGALLDTRTPNPTLNWDGNQLTKKGNGTLVLTADNTYTGGSTIEAGTLQLGNGGSTGSMLNAVLNNGILAVNRSDSVALNNLISGSGSITQMGSGILELTNTGNTYSGGTNVYSGTLLVSALDALGQGQINNNSQITFSGAAGDFENAITGTGNVAFSTRNSILNSNVVLKAALNASTITIDADNTTTIASTEAFAGNVSNNGELIVDTSSDRVLNNDISGTGSMTQNSNAVLFMTGNSSYSGGTNINNGTVAISSVTALGTGAINNDATLAFSAATGDFANAILAPQTTSGNSLVSFTNGSNVRIMAALAADDVSIAAGSSATVVAGETWTVTNSVNNAGNLLLGAGSTVASNVDITGRMSLVGNAVSADITGNLTNSGNLDLGGDGISSHLRVGGNYVGSNGVLTLNAQLNDDNSATDLLSITGTASGRTQVIVNNIGGQGADTVRGIKVIETGGSAAEAFYLQGGFVSAGAYDYSLQSLAEAGGVNWYLANSDINGGEGPTYTPNLGSAIANTAASNQMFNMRFEDRQGAGRQQMHNAPEDNLWVRSSGGKNSFTSLNKQLHTDGSTSAVQVGMGLPNLLDSESWDVGLMAGYGHYSGKTISSRTERKSTSRVNGYSFGVYGTWFSDLERQEGMYVDSWLQWAKFNNHVRGADDNSYSYNSSGVIASVELGANLEVGQFGSANVWVQPQVQVVYQGVRADKVKEHHGIDVTHGYDNVQLRTGIKTYTDNVTLGDTSIVSRPFIELNYIHNTEPYSTKIDGKTYRAAGGKDIGEVRFGLESRVANDHQLWFNYAYAAGGKNYRDQSLHLGWKYDF